MFKEEMMLRLFFAVALSVTLGIHPHAYAGPKAWLHKVLSCMSFLQEDLEQLNPAAIITQDLEDSVVVDPLNWQRQDPYLHKDKPIVYKVGEQTVGPMLIHSTSDLSKRRQKVIQEIIQDSKSPYNLRMAEMFLAQEHRLSEARQLLKNGVETGKWIITLKSGRIIESKILTTYSPDTLYILQVFAELKKLTSYAEITSAEFYHVHPRDFAAAGLLSLGDIHEFKLFAEEMHKQGVCPSIHIYAVAPNSTPDLISHYSIQRRP